MLRALTRLLLLAGLLAGTPARALDPARHVLQFKHTAWTRDAGAPPNIASIAQTPDGYLWLASSNGLYRFDGVTFERIAPDLRDPARSEAARMLLAMANGDLWVGFETGGVALYRHGGWVPGTNLRHPVAQVMQIIDDGSGGVWVISATQKAPIAHFSQGRWQEYGVARGFPEEYPSRLVRARDGTIWVSTWQSVVYLKPGAARFERLPVAVTLQAGVVMDPDGRIWLSDEDGGKVLSGPPAWLRGYPTEHRARGQSARFIFDRDGNVWGRAREKGIFYLPRPIVPGAAAPAPSDAAREQFFEAKDGLTSDSALIVFEDREGTIWVGTAGGLDRFRAANIVFDLTVPPAADDGYLASADNLGRVYLADGHTLYRVDPGGTPRIVMHDVSNPLFLCPDTGDTMWFGSFDGLYRLSGRRATLIQYPPGAGEHSLYMCGVDRHGAVWITVGDQGLQRFTGDKWQHFAIFDPRTEQARAKIAIDPQGRPIVQYRSTSLDRIDYPRMLPLWSGQIMRTGSITMLYQGAGGLLVGGQHGLARYRNEKFQWLLASQYPWLNRTVGAVETPRGETWLMTAAGIVRVSTRALDAAFEHPGSPVDYQLFDSRDGLRGSPQFSSRPDMAVGADGRIWLVTDEGAHWIDPAHLARNPLPPPVAIRALVADGTSYPDPSQLRLAAGARNIEIDYSALSLALPERVQFRYRLEGVDGDWIDPGGRRQAFYTNLGPGHYRFQVIAANNDGVWNRTGATLAFDVPPTFFQSVWFALLCMVAVGGLLWIAYTLRVRQVTARLRGRLEERLAERERIARELHDTLLQGFQGLILRFQSVADRIPPEQPIRPLIDQALDRADAVLIEGRDRVRHLRATSNRELPQVLVDAAKDFAIEHEARFELIVEGTPQPLHPLVFEEVARIGEEALRNAFHHAQADTIEAVLVYQPRELRLGIRDDGIGIDAEVAAAGGREGHYGLVGMRERAQRISAELSLSSRPGAGTEVLLAVPGRVAYARPHRRWRWWASRDGFDEEHA